MKGLGVVTERKTTKEEEAFKMISYFPIVCRF